MKRIKSFSRSNQSTQRRPKLFAYLTLFLHASDPHADFLTSDEQGCSNVGVSTDGLTPTLSKSALVHPVHRMREVSSDAGSRRRDILLNSLPHRHRVKPGIISLSL
jgi:hypothetical protein